MLVRVHWQDLGEGENYRETQPEIWQFRKLLAARSALLPSVLVKSLLFFVKKKMKGEKGISNYFNNFIPEYL